MITINKSLIKYHNGNYDVEIFSDGTKVRSYPEDIIPEPQFPESIDLKITNKCNIGCRQCHEMSIPTGKEADYDSLIKLVDTFKPGMEVAIGGGDPLSYDKLTELLAVLKEKGCIANLTINSKNLDDLEDLEYLIDCLENRYIYGLGVSYSSDINEKNLMYLMAASPNVIIHVIAGYHSYNQIKYITELFPNAKILILGYKQFGRGDRYYFMHKEPIERNIRTLKFAIQTIISGKTIISFDNLAIEQLELRRLFTAKEWDKLYMGDDGKFTMYVDAVKQEYAVSSTSTDRLPIIGLSISEAFQSIQ